LKNRNKLKKIKIKLQSHPDAASLNERADRLDAQIHGKSVKKSRELADELENLRKDVDSMIQGHSDKIIEGLLENFDEASFSEKDLTEKKARSKKAPNPADLFDDTSKSLSEGVSVFSPKVFDDNASTEKFPTKEGSVRPAQVKKPAHKPPVKKEVVDKGRADMQKTAKGLIRQLGAAGRKMAPKPRILEDDLLGNFKEEDFNKPLKSKEETAETSESVKKKEKAVGQEQEQEMRKKIISQTLDQESLG
jgi:hypothetical protein